MSNILNKKNITTDDWIEHYEWKSNTCIERANYFNRNNQFLEKESLRYAVSHLEKALRERRLHILNKHCGR